MLCREITSPPVAPTVLMAENQSGLTRIGPDTQNACPDKNKCIPQIVRNDKGSLLTSVFHSFRLPPSNPGQCLIQVCNKVIYMFRTYRQTYRTRINVLSGQLVRIQL